MSDISEDAFYRPEEDETPESLGFEPTSEVSASEFETLDLVETPWYETAAQAVIEVNAHGFGEDEELLNGTFPIISTRANGATRVRTIDGDLVWVSPSFARRH